jgi:hypothetical protein
MNEDIRLFFIVGALFGIGSLAIILTIIDRNPRQIQEKWQKEAISHGAARYEVDTNGVVSFKWNK